MKRAQEPSPGGYHENECVKQDLNLDREIAVALGSDSNRFIRRV